MFTSRSLLFWFCSIVVCDVEILHAIGVLARCNESEILTHVLLLEVLLGQVLKIALAEWDARLNDDSILLL